MHIRCKCAQYSAHWRVRVCSCGAAHAHAAIAWLKANPVRVVVKPDGGFLLIDGHHAASALYRRQSVFKDLPTDDPERMMTLQLYIEIACNWRDAFDTDFTFWQLVPHHPPTPPATHTHRTRLTHAPAPPLFPALPRPLLLLLSASPA